MLGRSSASDPPDSIAYPRIAYFLSVACVIVVFPLIWMGGLVTTTAAGMAVPDWPGTFGYNLFLYPLRDWFFGPWDLFVEHGHRLLGSLAGFIAIGLVIGSIATDRRRTMWAICGLALALIIVQGVLGGFRVLLDDRTLAKFHGCLGPAFFGFMVAVAVANSRWWARVPRLAASDSLAQWGSAGHSLQQRTWIMLVLSFLQLVVGAHLRHIAVDADPLHYRTLVIAHLVLAGAIFLGSIAVVLAAGRLSGTWSARFRGLAWLLFGLVGLQLMLGLSTWLVKFGWPVWFDQYYFAASFIIEQRSFLQMNVITSHVAVGSLIIAIATLLAVSASRVAWVSQQPSHRQEAA